MGKPDYDAYFKLADDVNRRIASQESRPEESNLPIPPDDPQLFYKDFGLLPHPRTHEPVPALATYQEDIWRLGQRYKYRLVIKSQKVGITTSALLEDFWRAITVCKGQEILIIAQSQDMANEHIRTFKSLVINSAKYAPYLITDSSDMLFKEEKTKVRQAYIRNRDNPLKPTRVIGVGAHESQVWSWKNVGHIHMSDIAAAELKDDSGLFAAAFSRLANTGGTILIETPPRGPRGKIYDIYLQSKQAQAMGEQVEGQFKIRHVYASDALAPIVEYDENGRPTGRVVPGLIAPEHLEAEKVRLGRLYPQYYEAEFIAAGGNVFLPEQIERATSINYVPELKPYATTAMGIDPAFGSSKFAFVVTQFVDGIIQVLYADEFDRADFEDMVQTAWRLYRNYNAANVYIDAANPAFIRALKGLIGEEIDYEEESKDSYRFMTVVPVNFRTEHQSMLSHMQALVAKGLVAVHPKFEKLLSQMRTAQEYNGKLDKSINSLDLIDALRLNLLHYQFQET